MKFSIRNRQDVVVYDNDDAQMSVQYASYQIASAIGKYAQDGGDTSQLYFVTHYGSFVPIPKLDAIDAQILDAIRDGNGELEMDDWHGDGFCDTKHCRAGWATHLAGPSGKTFESLAGSIGNAAALIYLVSRPGQDVPSFYMSNNDALEDIRRCAAEQVAAIAATK